MKTLSRFTALSTVLSVVYWWLFASRVELIRFQDGSLTISDFSYYAVLVRGFWFEGHRGFYNLADNIEVLKSLTSPDFRWVMPLAVTPSAVFVFAPFSWIAQTSIAWAQSIWVGMGLSCLFLSGLSFFSSWKKNSQLRESSFIVIFGLLLSSQVFFINLAQGQTSIFFLATLLFLAASGDRPLAWPQFFACFFAGVKPAYLLFVLFLLLGLKNWRLVFLSLLQVAASVGVFTLLCGTGWLAEYQYTFSLFKMFPLPEQVASAFYFDGMNLFRTAFKGFIEERTAVEWSNRLLFLGLFFSGLSLLRLIVLSIRGEDQKKFHFLTPLYLLMGCYFLFSPYIGTYEEILLSFPPLGACVFRKRPVPPLLFLGVLLFLALSLNFTQLMPWIGEEGKTIAWIAKSQVFFLSYLLLTSPRELREGEEQRALRTDR